MFGLRSECVGLMSVEVQLFWSFTMKGMALFSCGSLCIQFKCDRYYICRSAPFAIRDVGWVR